MTDRIHSVRTARVSEGWLCCMAGAVPAKASGSNPLVGLTGIRIKGSYQVLSVTVAIIPGKSRHELLDRTRRAPFPRGAPFFPF